jgi:hypothetical protein
MSAVPPKSSLHRDLDEMFHSLMEECGASTSEDATVEGRVPLSFRDRLDLFKAGITYLATKNKVEADVPSDDEFGKLRTGYNRGAGRGSRGATASNGASGNA